MFAKIRSKLRARSKRRSQHWSGVWVAKDTGLEITDANDDVEFLSWPQIDAIVGFRATRTRTNEIYLEFRHGREFTLLEESNPHFDTVRAEVERRYAIAPEWFGRLAAPSSEEESICLWRRDPVESLRRA